MTRDPRSASSALPKFLRVIESAINGVVVVGFVALLVVISWNVLGRIAFGRAPAWADEAARFLFIWTCFLGAAAAYFRRQHVAVGVFVERLPPKLQFVANIVEQLVVLVVLAFLFVGSLRLIAVTFRTSPLLNIPMRVVFYALPVSAVLMALAAIHRMGRPMSRYED